MRIPFPIYIPLLKAAGFAALLFLVEIYQGTAPAFAICAFIFIVIATLTFNLAGGLSRPSGAYVFFYSILAVILGLVWKAILGEPADTNLAQPNLTMEVYVGSIAAMWIAVAVSRKLALKRPLLGNLVTPANMQNAAVGCMVTGITMAVALQTVEVQQGSALSALSQINRFLPLALILGIIYEIRRTGGRRSVSWIVLISGGAIFCQGLLGFSKEAIFTPFACWLIAAGSQGYRFSKAQIFSLVIGILLMGHYLVPYAQYGRNFVEPTFAGRVRTSVDLLSDLEDTRTKYESSSADYYDRRIQGYFDTSQGLMDRLQMISPDDVLHDLTEKRGPIGSFPIIMEFENLIPHFLWPSKPAVNFGNFYAHEMGGLADDDVTTGVSFSPSGEAFHVARWMGIFFWAPLVWILLFTLFDSLCGDTRVSPWGLLMCAYFAHIAPEAGLAGAIYMMGPITVGLVVAAFASAYVMPLIGTLFKGPSQVTVHRGIPVRGVPRRARTLPQPGIGQ